MRGGDPEPECCQRRRGKDSRRKPTDPSTKSFEDHLIAATLRIKGGESHRAANADPDDDTGDVSEHKKAVLIHQSPLVAESRKGKSTAVDVLASMTDAARPT
jgi:hypothetical protein